MKKYLIIMLILIILFILVIGMPHSILAVNTNITSNEFIEEFNPNKEVDGTGNDLSQSLSSPIMNAIVAITNPILGALQIIGGFVAVLSIAFFGFKQVFSADPRWGKELGFDTRYHQTRLELEALARVLIIGSVILFSSATLVRIVFKILTE